MSGLLLFFRARGGAVVCGVLAAIVVADLTLQNQLIFDPGSPEGTLVQAWFPIAVSLAAARASYDSTGPLSVFAGKRVQAIGLGWLVAVGCAALLVSQPAAPAAESSIYQIRPALPVGLTVAVAYLTSCVAPFWSAATISFVWGTALFFAARPALTGGDSWVTAIWDGLNGADIVVSVLIVIAAAAVKSMVEARRQRTGGPS